MALIDKSPSDTNAKYTRAYADVNSSVGVVREVHAQLVVDGALVLRVGVGQDGGDVLEFLPRLSPRQRSRHARVGYPPETK